MKLKKRFGEGRKFADYPGNVVIYNNIGEIIKLNLKRHDRVCIEGFGCFERRKINGRQLFNKRFGRILVTKPYVKISFVPATAFRKLINQ